jgi:ZIP family zinc transporter
VLFILLISAATGLCTGAGSLPFFIVDKLPRRAYDTVLGFGAGLMLSAATLGLLAEALSGARRAGELSQGQFALVLLGFIAGFALLFAVERLIPHEHAGGHHEHLRAGAQFHDERSEAVEIAQTAEGARADDVRRGMLISGALVFHRLPEGFAIGASFASGETRPLGFLVAITVALQNVCEGMVMSAPLRRGGISRVTALLVTSATGLAVPLTAAVGYFFAQGIAGAMPFALALAAGSLISVTSNEIIPETHSHGNEAPATLGIVAGFIVTMVMRVALGVD